MTSDFSVDDLDHLTAVVAASWRAGADRDWSVPAGSLDWSCARTADHAVDTVLAPAFFLASRKVDAYPAGEWSMGPEAGPTAFVEGLETASRILGVVVQAAPADVRAIIWRLQEPTTAPPKDFVPRGAMELILHAHDVASGLGVAFDPPTAGCERLRGHTQHWPMWTIAPGWSPLSMTGDPWADLLRSSGRQPTA
jgi:hypothetical protein